MSKNDLIGEVRGVEEGKIRIMEGDNGNAVITVADYEGFGCHVFPVFNEQQALEICEHLYSYFRDK